MTLAVGVAPDGGWPDIVGPSICLYGRAMDDDSDLLADQLAYYRAVAEEYHDHAIDAPGQRELLEAIDAFAPSGDVLELACGSGVWTERLARAARSVTAVDGAPEMLTGTPGPFYWGTGRR